MSNNLVINATIRNDIRKGANRRLRCNNLIPAIIYGGNKNPTSITLEHHRLQKALENEAFYTQIVTIKLDGEEEKVILRDLQRHPCKIKIMHADFQRINPKEKIVMHIPLHFKGGDIAPGVKLKGGIVTHLLSEIELRCFPQDLPEYVEVDLSQLDIEETIHLSDLILPKNTEIPRLIPNSSNDKPVASIYTPRIVSEEMGEPTIKAQPVETIAEAKAKKEEEEAQINNTESKKKS